MFVDILYSIFSLFLYLSVFYFQILQFIYTIDIVQNKCLLLFHLSVFSCILTCTLDIHYYYYYCKVVAAVVITQKHCIFVCLSVLIAYFKIITTIFHFNFKFLVLYKQTNKKINNTNINNVMNLVNVCFDLCYLSI